MTHQTNTAILYTYRWSV